MVTRRSTPLRYRARCVMLETRYKKDTQLDTPMLEQPTSTNLLEHAASSYLRSARHQPVQWHPWGEEAFARAIAEDKPVLLDIGAVWCHWCHVMDRESYENPEIAAILNEHFIAVKVDRDERPDVDARYQAAVSAISGQGGWPLTAFLTPDGRPFFGGTYFPAEERYGRPGMKRVLLTMADSWRTRREEVLESAASVMAAVEQNENFSGRGTALSFDLTDKIVASILKQFDPRHGGFGSQPKFPHPAALDLLLDVAVRTGNEQARDAALVTLRRMRAGGVYDQLAGGFHRYSVDERWVVPHFEKMLYDNSELLRCYIHAYQSFVEPEFAQTAQEIIAWLDCTMTDRAHGGFFSSQDADINLEDDGDYFTWTRDEARAVLTDREFSLAARYWDIGELGDMHHNPRKNVLHMRFSLEDAARESGVSPEDARKLLVAAQQKLLAARAQRPTPFIDRTLYTGWNAMAITAYLEAGRVLRVPAARDFALKSLDRLLAQAWDGGQELAHVIAYAESSSAPRIAGTLEDYAFTIHACIDAWLATGAMEYYRSACKLADAMIALFLDRTASVFLDLPVERAQSASIGALVARRRPLQDAPTPAGNPVAVAALLRLEPLSGRAEYREIAEDVLEAFAGIVEHFGLYVGTYALTLNRFLLDPLQVVVVGDEESASRLEALATARFAVNKTVIRLQARQLLAETLPEALAQTIPQVALPSSGAAWALVCRGRTCLPPIDNPDQLLDALEMNPEA